MVFQLRNKRNERAVSIAITDVAVEMVAAGMKSSRGTSSSRKNKVPATTTTTPATVSNNQPADSSETTRSVQHKVKSNNERSQKTAKIVLIPVDRSPSSLPPHQETSQREQVKPTDAKQKEQPQMSTNPTEAAIKKETKALDGVPLKQKEPTKEFNGTKDGVQTRKMSAEQTKKVDEKDTKKRKDTVPIANSGSQTTTKETKEPKKVETEVSTSSEKKVSVNSSSGTPDETVPSSTTSQTKKSAKTSQPKPSTVSKKDTEKAPLEHKTKSISDNKIPTSGQKTGEAKKGSFESKHSTDQSRQSAAMTIVAVAAGTAIGSQTKIVSTKETETAKIPQESKTTGKSKSSDTRKESSPKSSTELTETRDAVADFLEKSENKDFRDDQTLSSNEYYSSDSAAGDTRIIGQLSIFEDETLANVDVISSLFFCQEVEFYPRKLQIGDTQTLDLGDLPYEVFMPEEGNEKGEVRARKVSDMSANMLEDPTLYHL